MLIKRTYVSRPKCSVYAYSRRRNICEIYQRAHEEVVQVATLWSDRRRPIIDNRGKAYILSIPLSVEPLLKPLEWLLAAAWWRIST